MSRNRTTIKGERKIRRTCAHCGRVGHRARKHDGTLACERPAKRIDMIGIEIEGYWYDLGTMKRKAQEITGRQGERDGSLEGRVNVASGDDDDYGCECDDDDCTCASDAYAYGWEFQTRAGTLGHALSQLYDLYPDVTGSECGMHVHMSLHSHMDFSLLASDRFYEYFRAQLQAWGERNQIWHRSEFWNRLRGENSYCYQNSETHDHHRRSGQLITSIGDKYRQINFLPWNQYKTVEFRVLPMFRKHELAQSAIECLVEIVESFLAQEELDIAISTGIAESVEPIDLGTSEIVIPDSTHTVNLDGPEIDLVDIRDASPGSIVALRCDALRVLQEQLTSGR